MSQSELAYMPVGHRLSLRPQADLWPTSHTQSDLPFNGLHTRNPCNCMDYYSFTDPGGMEGWVGLCCTVYPDKFIRDNVVAPFCYFLLSLSHCLRILSSLLGLHGFLL